MQFYKYNVLKDHFKGVVKVFKHTRTTFLSFVLFCTTPLSTRTTLNLSLQTL